MGHWFIDKLIDNYCYKTVQGFFAVGQFTVRKKKPNLIWLNLTETNIFSYGELSHGEVSYGEKSTHVSKHMCFTFKPQEICYLCSGNTSIYINFDTFSQTTQLNNSYI